MTYLAKSGLVRLVAILEVVVRRRADEIVA